MPPLKEERLKIATEVLNSIGLENNLTPVQARAYVRCLQTAWQVPTIQWGAGESNSQLDDALRLSHTAGIFREIEGITSKDATNCFRRAGEILEWLSRAEKTFHSSVPIELLAAGAYQLGGLPAMATGLLRQLEQQTTGTELYARFLKADFDGVLQSVSEFWEQHPGLTDREAPTRLLEEEEDDKISWYFTVELVRSLGLFSYSLRWGNSDRLNRALKKLNALDQLALRSFSEDISMLVNLLCRVSESFRDASIYEPIRKLSELNPERTQNLLNFARGQFRRGRGILWTSQRQGLTRLLEESSFALCTPTGSGKTLVANLAIVKELLLKEHEGLPSLALYLVPSRALAGEVEAKLSGELDNEFIITGLYGGADWGVTDFWLNATKPTVLIATVEKADALMRYLGPILLTRLRLLIVDEAHQVVPENNENTKTSFADHSNRAIRLEAFVSRLLTQAPEIVRIALTAVAGGAASPVASWIEGNKEASPIGIQYRSTRQVIGVLETRLQSSGRMLLELINGRPLYVRGRDKPVYINLRTPSMPTLPSEMLTSINRFNQLDVLWASLHLKNDKRRILISVAQEPEKTMRWYKEALERSDWSDASSFTPPENVIALDRFNETRATCVDYCGEDSYEVALLDHGIATNYGQMPQRLRRLMTDLIERGICPITVATATLTEGVNLPFDNIFLTTLKRQSFNPDTKQQIIAPLTTSEFKNLAGRAGRPGTSKGMEGMTLIAIPQSPSTKAPGKISNQRKQIKQLEKDYINLRGLLISEEMEMGETVSAFGLLLNTIAENAKRLLDIDGDAFLDWLEGAIPFEISKNAGQMASSTHARLADSIDELDGILLNALEELNRNNLNSLENSDAESFLSNLWQKSFTAYASEQEEWMEKAFVNRGRAIINKVYPNPDERKRLYQYGFSPYIGRRFEKSIAPKIRDILESTTDYGVASHKDRFTTFCDLGDLLVTDRGYGFRVRQTATDQSLLENWTDVLAWWMHQPGAITPEPIKLRNWQRFTADNLDFRLGVAIGAVVAQAWSHGTDSTLEVPSLALWREKTGLPWFGFWARELLRWGTLDPFVAFALARGLAQTRTQAAQRREDFESWGKTIYVILENEDMIDPQLFLKWQASFLPRHESEVIQNNSINVELIGTTGQGEQYRVIPVRNKDYVDWIDAAGYTLARSSFDKDYDYKQFYRDDFELNAKGKNPIVRRVFTAH